MTDEYFDYVGSSEAHCFEDGNVVYFLGDGHVEDVVDAKSCDDEYGGGYEGDDDAAHTGCCHEAFVGGLPVFGFVAGELGKLGGIFGCFVGVFDVYIDVGDIDVVLFE